MEGDEKTDGRPKIVIDNPSLVTRDTDALSLHSDIGVLLQAKTVKRNGQGILKPIWDGTVCVYRMESNGTSADTEYVPSTFTIGEAECKEKELVDKCLKTMKEGESSFFILSQSTKDFQQREINLELISFKEPEKLLWDLEPEEILERAQTYKGKGNRLFREGNIEFAFKNYCRALKYLLSMLPERYIPDDIGEDFKVTRCHCYLNLAACQMRVEQWHFVEENCTKALSCQPSNVKALYRRSQAYIKLDNFSAAQKDLRYCLKIEPSSKSAQTALKEVDVKLKTL